MKRFGATGKFPEGKINPYDEGELRFGVTTDSNGLVHINFGAPVTWMAFPKETAIQLAKMLLKAAGATKIEISFGGPPDANP